MSSWTNQFYTVLNISSDLSKTLVSFSNAKNARKMERKNNCKFKALSCTCLSLCHLLLAIEIWMCLIFRFSRRESKRPSQTHLARIFIRRNIEISSSVQSVPFLTRKRQHIFKVAQFERVEKKSTLFSSIKFRWLSSILRRRVSFWVCIWILLCFSFHFAAISRSLHRQIFVRIRSSMLPWRCTTVQRLVTFVWA